MSIAGGSRQWYKMTVAYDGSAYSGWQVQPGRLTIQSMLELAIKQICGEQVRVTGSGRTDTGVHAIAQVASFSLATWRASAADLCRALNSKLPNDISISSISDAPEDFHAIRDATGKRYRYQLQIGGSRDAFEYRYRWHLQGPIDVAAMQEAAKHLVGKHDFASFQATGAERKSTIRDVRELVITREPTALAKVPVCEPTALAAGPGCEPTALAAGLTEPIRNVMMPEAAAHGSPGQGRAGQGRAGQGRGPVGSQYVSLEIEADGFLYNMVRNIVGTLIEVGRGKQSPAWVADVLAGADRTKAGPTAPPHGLFLMRVDY